VATTVAIARVVTGLAARTDSFRSYVIAQVTRCRRPRGSARSPRARADAHAAFLLNVAGGGRAARGAAARFGAGRSARRSGRAPAFRAEPPGALDRGGTLAIAGIYLSDIPPLKYESDLFQERTVRSVTANTRRDGRDLFDFAARYRLRVTVTPYAMKDVPDALADLAADRVNGAAVLLP
jgi:hypothetical protein